MAKFNTYTIHAENQDGQSIVEKQISALSIQSAWHKAVEEVFDVIEPGTGDVVGSINLWRVKPARESHG
jgi:hypothetical protein